MKHANMLLLPVWSLWYFFTESVHVGVRWEDPHYLC